PRAAPCRLALPLARARARPVVAAPEGQEVLRAVALADFVLVRQVVADRGDVEVAGLDEDLDRLDDRRVERLLLVLRIPRRLLLEVARVPGERGHRGRHRLVGDGDKALRAALGAAGVAVDLDEPV